MTSKKGRSFEDGPFFRFTIPKTELFAGRLQAFFDQAADILVRSAPGTDVIADHLTTAVDDKNLRNAILGFERVIDSAIGVLHHGVIRTMAANPLSVVRVKGVETKVKDLNAAVSRIFSS
jgi:hypothetical protein